MSPKIIKADFEGQQIQFNDAGWFNATAIAAKEGKRLDHWLSNAETKKYIEILNTRIHGDLIKTKRGKNGGTWMHPKLGVIFARWVSVDFAIWCDEQIETIIHGKPEQTDWKRVRHQAASSYKVMSDILTESRSEQGKETKHFHYANEAKLINHCISGQYAPLDRELLSLDELDLLAKLEAKNTVLIARGADREQRKETLHALAEMHKTKLIGQAS